MYGIVTYIGVVEKLISGVKMQVFMQCLEWATSTLPFRCRGCFSAQANTLSSKAPPHLDGKNYVKSFIWRFDS